MAHRTPAQLAGQLRSQILRKRFDLIVCATALVEKDAVVLPFPALSVISVCPKLRGVGLAKASAVFCGEERTIPELLSYFESIGSGDALEDRSVSLRIPSKAASLMISLNGLV